MLSFLLKQKNINLLFVLWHQLEKLHHCDQITVQSIFHFHVMIIHPMFFQTKKLIILVCTTSTTTLSFALILYFSLYIYNILTHKISLVNVRSMVWFRCRPRCRLGALSNIARSSTICTVR